MCGYCGTPLLDSRLINPGKARFIYLLSVLLPGSGHIWHGSLLLGASVFFGSLVACGLLLLALSVSGLAPLQAVVFGGLWVSWAVGWTVHLKFLKASDVSLQRWVVSLIVVLLIGNLLLFLYWTIVLLSEYRG